MFRVGLILAILFVHQHFITALPTEGTKVGISQISENGGRLQTPDEFLQELYPHSDIKTIWQKISEDIGGTNEQSHHISERGQQTHVRQSNLEKQQGDYLQEIMFNETLDVTCGTPQPLVIDSYKELGLVKGSSDKVLPACFRVNRCRHSGCCADGFVCKPKHSVLVEKKYLLYDTNTRQVHLKSHNVVNHSNCSCVKIVCRKQTCPVTKVWNKDTCSCECARRCPDQFIQDRNTCLCECTLDDRQCLKISKGITKLPKEQCRALDWKAVGFVTCERGKTFYKECCKCLKKPCEKAKASIQLKVQTSPGAAPDETPFVGDTLFLSSSFSASIISKIDEASFDSQENKYKLMSQSNMDSSSEDSSEE